MKQRIIDRIAADGPLRFDEYMSMCLYDPDDGFFSAGNVRSGTTGDFITSPEVSPWFGRLLGRWADSVRSSDDATLVEVGSGSGSLLATFIEEVPHWAGVWAVEASGEARASVAARIHEATVVERLDEVPTAGEVVVIANEVLDNLPARLVQRSGVRWTEHRVDLVEGTLVLVVVEADAELARWCDRHLGDAPDGVVLAAQIEMGDWLIDVVRRFPTVHLCVVDYAADTATLAERRPSDIVRTYHRQRSGADALARPGDTDITVDVNIDVVRSIIESLGARLTIVDQGAFLSDLGADDVISDLTRRSHERAQAGDVMAQLRFRSEAVDLRALLERPGFGSFTVFLVESPS